MLPYQNSDLPIKDRVTDLLNRMTLKEKVGQVNQNLYGWQCYHFDSVTKTVQLDQKLLDHIEWGAGLGAIYGLFRADPWSQVDFASGVAASDAWRVSNAVQHAVIEQSRLGIPALIVEECPHGHQGLDGISYPTNIGRGNSFDTELMRKTTRLMAQELALKGVNMALVSTLDLAKDPRWGRTEECFGEDPILSAKMSEAVVTGFQGNLIQDGISFVDQTVHEINRQPGNIGVVLKHCIAQGEAQGGHNSGAVVLGEREFTEIYQPLLRATRNAIGVMAAYNDVNGVPCHINRHLFTQLLRQQEGFQGLVMADGTALDRLADVFDDQEAAAGAALSAGVDLSLWDTVYTEIEAGITLDKVTEADLDQAVAHVLSIKFLLGLFEHPYVVDPNSRLEHVLEASQRLNEQVATESITLVKNDQLLPLTDQSQTIAVIGPSANEYYNLLGDYTAPQTITMQEHTLVNELKAALPQATIKWSVGCEIRNSKRQMESIRQAVAVAKNADVIVLVLGGSSTRNFDMSFLQNGAVSSREVNMDSGENVDVADLALGGQQLQLLSAINALHKPTIGVMIQGRPYDIRPVLAMADAVLIGWFPGQMGGTALSKLIAGKANPSGKLSVSYPRCSQQLPVYYYQRAVTKQDNYYDELGTPLFEFGTGLSYTDFIYSDITAERTNEGIKATVLITNAGGVTGSTPILLFVKLHGGRVVPRKQMLRDFKRVTLTAGSSQRVIFNLLFADVALINQDMESELAERIEIRLGSETITFHL
ncbi:beta-glucosidase [Lactiplantibacillus fabifermentans T30PCM01]|uniref:Beta-glucosidase n=1 Tax=Lactiplantibacillus fabifermentans T30PCM01 TaxID=1400520 RepID=W6T434_9LACO|nr:glycoside hydrolase family 3 N-terminal domain-containing protein [Lactiplantibacillus fabifermentans]ETY72682.1 beta-glucosidase [Lactiplantibacillus fabifermentans T30PCM01]